MPRLVVRLAISAAIAALAICWLMGQGFDVLPAPSVIGSIVGPAALITYFALFTAFHFLRAWRWLYLIRPFAAVRTKTMVDVALVGFLAIQMLPLRTGEFARPYLLDRYAGISKSALFGTIAIERVIDGLVISLMLTAALFAVPAERAAWVWPMRLLPTAVFGAALALLVAFYVRPAATARFTGGVLGLFSSKLAAFAVGVVERFHQGLAALPDKRSFWAFVFVTLVYWLINALSFHLLAAGCGLELSFVGALAGMACLAVGILLPAGPGYFGNFQVAVLAAVGLYLPISAADERAAVFVFALYTMQTGLTILYGGLGALGLRGQPVVKRVPSEAPSPFRSEQRLRPTERPADHFKLAGRRE